MIGWLVDLCGQPKERQADPADTAELDTSQAVARAKAYLETADPAIQGAGGDERTYKTAATVLDFGLSREMAAEVMQPWNERCAPPWLPEDLERKISNAWAYRLNGVGSSDPKQEFDEWRAPETSPFAPISAAGLRTNLDPPPAYQLGHFTERGEITLIAAPPAVGKSSMTFGAALSVATGRNLLGMEPHERARVWMWNNEDSMPWLRRRLLAAANAFEVSDKDLDEWVYLNSGDVNQFLIAKEGENGAVVATFALKEVERFIVERKIGLFVIDPFRQSHGLSDDNANMQVAKVARLLKNVAVRTNCAIVLVHHFKKTGGAKPETLAGNMEMAAGASALESVARLRFTLTVMTDSEAGRFGVPKKERFSYVALTQGGMNHIKRSGEGQWFKIHSQDVPTATGSTAAIGVVKHHPMVQVEEASPEEALCVAVADFCAGREMSRSAVVDYLRKQPAWRELQKRTVRNKVTEAAGTAEELGLWKLVVAGTGARDSAKVIPLQVDSVELAEAEDVD